MKGLKNRAFKILCLVLAGVLFYFSIKDICVLLMEYRRAEESYDHLGEDIEWIETLPDIVFGTLPEEPDTTLPHSAWVDLREEELPLPEVNFEALSQVNPDIVCWLYCPDTVINYPVCQGEDNEYYLTHLFDGTINSAGCLFIDSEQEPLNRYNTVIYGHAMKDRSMFRTILDYQQKGQAFYEMHPAYYLMLPDGRVFRIELFSGYLTDDKNGTAWLSDFADEEEFDRWIMAAKENSVFQADVLVSSKDRILTMSTCSFDPEDPWFVVHGKMVLIRTEK